MESGTFGQAAPGAGEGGGRQPQPIWDTQGRGAEWTDPKRPVRAGNPQTLIATAEATVGDPRFRSGQGFESAEDSEKVGAKQQEGSQMRRFGVLLFCCRNCLVVLG